ncbi:MAG: AAA family ATPase, partial [Eggerthellaceae bacterium]|nr:AAA family ATPase [Eggerthellaceae bacterium]
VADIERKLSSEKQRIAEIDKRVSAASPELDSLKSRMDEANEQLKGASERETEAVLEMRPLNGEAASLKETLSGQRVEVSQLSERVQYSKRIYRSLEDELSELKARNESLTLTKRKKAASVKRLTPLTERLQVFLDGASSFEKSYEKADSIVQGELTDLHDSLSGKSRESRRVHDLIDGLTKKVSELKVEKGRLEVMAQGFVDEIANDLNTPVEDALDLPLVEDRSGLEQNITSLKKRIEGLGSVNPDADAEYNELKSRHDYLRAQLEDLTQAQACLKKIDSAIDIRMKEAFLATFERVNDNFSEIFTTLFPGGSASLSLIGEEDGAEGVEVNAQPKGKRLAKMSLLSGGEKSLAALALLFAIYECSSTPFYILDEVEAALDDTNLRRLVNYLEKLRSTSQLLLITHQRRTMEMADVLLGVSMQADGVTKVISQRLKRDDAVLQAG